jgi:hypothetical protein
MNGYENEEIMRDPEEAAERKRRIKEESETEGKFGQTWVERSTNEKVVIKTNPRQEKQTRKYEFDVEKSVLVCYGHVTGHVIDYVRATFLLKVRLLSYDQRRLPTITTKKSV